MPWPALRSDITPLRALVVGIGVCWSVAFIVIALCYQLQLYADGAMFSYAVAVEDVWAFHWHNISGRLSVFLLGLLPAETLVRVSGNAGAGIMAYGALFYAAPLAGLIGTFAADRSRGRRDTAFLRSAAALAVVLVLSIAMKIVVPPDEYYAGVLVRAARHFFDPAIFQVSIVLLLLATLAGYATIFLVLAQLAPRRANVHAAVIVLIVLAIYWLWLDDTLHASSRYYLRTALVIATPVFGALASLATHEGGRFAPSLPGIAWAMTTVRNRGARPLAAIFLLLTVVHLVETGKFVAAWADYRAAVTAFAQGNQSDPVLGNPRFVSSERISASLNRLSWFSTTPYLSVIVAHFLPHRLVIDPLGNYFWLSCATATANEEAAHAVAADARRLVRIYSCLHR